MARKFDNIEIDGGKHVRVVTVKIEQNGIFEAAIDGETYHAPSLAELHQALTAAAVAADALTFSAVYQVDFRYDRPHVSALAVSDSVVEIKTADTPGRTGRNLGPARRMFRLKLGRDLTVPSPVNKGEALLPHYRNETATKSLAGVVKVWVRVTDATRVILRDACAQLDELTEQEKAIATRRDKLMSALEAQLREYRVTFDEDSDVSK